MTFTTQSNLSPDWYKDQHKQPQLADIPLSSPDTFAMPNSTSPYPPVYPNQNIVSSTAHNPKDGILYSGIEPLASIVSKPAQLMRLFQGTSVPQTGVMIYNPDMQRRQKYNQYQKPSKLGVEYYSR